MKKLPYFITGFLFSGMLTSCFSSEMPPAEKKAWTDSMEKHTAKNLTAIFRIQDSCKLAERKHPKKTADTLKY